MGSVRRKGKSVLVFLRVSRGACVQDVAACALNFWAYYRAPVGGKVCALPAATQLQGHVA